jgi:hypothetical protein
MDEGMWDEIYHDFSIYPSSLQHLPRIGVEVVERPWPASATFDQRTHGCRYDWHGQFLFVD